MDTPEPSGYEQAIHDAKERYQQDGDEKAYLAAGIYLNLHRIADGYNNVQVKTVLSVGQHVIKGAAETLIGCLFDPHHEETTSENAVQEMLHHTADEFFRDLEPIRAYLASLFGFRW